MPPTLGSYVCATCGLTMKPLRNGIFAVEMMNNTDAYKIWSADLLYCPHCESQVIVGFAPYPLMEHFEDGFQEKLDQLEKDDTKTVIRFY